MAGRRGVAATKRRDFRADPMWAVQFHTVCAYKMNTREKVAKTTYMGLEHVQYVSPMSQLYG